MSLCAAVSACASWESEGARYQGRRQPSVVSAEAIGSESELPRAYTELGEVEARCTLTQGWRRIEDERLSDVDCSESRLRRALRQRASDTGATLLAEERCSSQVLGTKANLRRTRVTCRALTARPEQLSKVPNLRAPQGINPPGMDSEAVRWQDEPDVSQAWRINIEFSPAPGATGAPPLRADLVHEIAVFPPSHVPLGDVVARCDSRCSVESVHAGVRIAAGRVGATDVIGIRCVSRFGGWVCSGTAATYKTAPDWDPRRR